tara:strand:- start:549 stop:1604 length:1056 start_codon:yes stop_codon:yes gene_type:complete
MEQTDKEVVPTTAEQEAFSKQYHWFYGLDEYFEFTGKSERWQVLKKAVLQQNWYRIRDVIIELATMPNSNPAHARAWINALLREKVSAEVKPQMMATLVRKYMHEDAFMVNICQFVNYWAKDDAAADMPDMNDFLSRGQVRSKLWLISELAKVVEGPIGNIVFYGGWYNFLAHMLFDQFEVDKIYSLDLDERVVAPSKRLYPEQVSVGRFLPLTTDVNTVEWNDGKLSYLNQAIRTNIIEKYWKTKEESIRQFNTDVNQLADDERWGWAELDDMQLIINTSCEHMNNEWFENVPSGKLVILQTNDYFENPQHSNCCKDLEEAKAKYPMQSVIYEGELDTELYNRFMLIGIK